MLEGGADIHDRDENGVTALMLAAIKNSNPEVVKALLTGGADIHAKDKMGATALISAAGFNPNPDVVKILLANGADIQARAKNDVTALMGAAAINPNPEVVKALLAGGADVRAVDKDGHNALWHAQQREKGDKEKIIQILKKYASSAAPAKAGMLGHKTSQVTMPPHNNQPSKLINAFRQQDKMKLAFIMAICIGAGILIGFYLKRKEGQTQKNPHEQAPMDRRSLKSTGDFQEYTASLKKHAVPEDALSKIDREKNIANVDSAIRRVPKRTWKVGRCLALFVVELIFFMLSLPLWHADTQYKLGGMYERGEGVRKNYATARKWYLKAAKQEHAEAQWRLGALYEFGLGVPEDETKAAEWYQKAAEQGDSTAQYALGDMYKEGRGVEKNYAKACEWYRIAAEQGDEFAQYDLGKMYFKGLGVEKDYQKAAEWFERSAAQGHSDAQCYLGQMYHEGQGVQQDYVMSIKWYKTAVARKNNRAKSILGQMYYLSQGGVPSGYGKTYEQCEETAVSTDVEQFALDYQKARNRWEQAAVKGNANAQYNMGAIYAEGYGCLERDDAKAVQWYQKAAEQGYAKAQTALGSCYEFGLGVKQQDGAKARTWYLKAAAQGDAYAQLFLGYMYYHGRTVRQNMPMAKEWFGKACNNGNQSGCKKFNELGRQGY